MLRTLEATIDETGRVQLNEPVVLSGRSRALVTILEEPDAVNECAILSEAALAEGWSGTEADAAWKHLADLPDLEEEGK
jgi:hypothetical protein